VVPAGTVGGSVSIIVNEADALAGRGRSEGLISRDTAIIAIAVRTAAEPYLKVHFLSIFPSPYTNCG